MEELIQGVAKFQKEVYPNNEAKFRKLANGQNPEVLFITCADSRIDPNLLTQTQPGDLFICRNAGNVVPPHSNQTGGMTASIEFAVAALGVSHIVVCGHSDCGAMKGALNPDALEGLPHVKEWLGHCRAASEVVKERHGHLDKCHLEEVAEENVLLQLQHLRTHPAVAAKIASGRVRLHGWIYNIGSGAVECYNEQTKKFEIMDSSYSLELEEGLAQGKGEVA
ncbi:Carbonic anhydrase 1 [Zhongshania aliphaticivorans]|uniref:Carbonic anhydrase n=1 Tax=Zhongshania aliphaticivorans TaxID=1470434 RepID=A0A5S9NAD9_9GAMM|nr:carbonic anhydrase [Zhongshania aliphaticivorans]CAA0087101.1 Carbonic anhydrase 1 [Zhongshania aliphaticivorans]CAA0114059.1 Carbonic anhydrase 1 [Zhongshania aliphaticivorans]